MDLLGDKIQGEFKYYIYGITNFSRYCRKYILENYGNDYFLGYVETAPDLNMADGKQVLAVSDISCGNGEKIIIGSFFHGDSMKKNLIQIGIAEDSIISFQELFPYFKCVGGTVEHFGRVFIYPDGWRTNEKLCEKIRWFMPDRIEIVEDADKADAILVYKATAASDLLEAYHDKVYIVDPEFFYYIESSNWGALYYSSFSGEELEAYREQSKQVFQKMEAGQEKRGVRKGNIFCSGPSIHEFIEQFEKYKGIDREFNIICNSMVKDKKMLDVIKPSLLAFTDLNYYFSPTAYCRQFMADVIEGWNKYHFYIAVYEYELPLFLKHYPMFKDYVFGLENNSKVPCFPSGKKLTVKRAANIMTETMLPVASELCDEIGIFGCTGRDEGEIFYWQHNDRTQYKELMQSVFDAYPSLFRDQEYEDYYKRHCQNVKNLIEYGESKGKKYYNYTVSFIPALKERSSSYPHPVEKEV